MLHLVNHPLITMKLNKMRDEKTNSKDFRTLLDEISSLMTYEVFKDVNLVSSGRKIKTPTGCEIDKLKLEHDIIIVPILRAGMGMSNGVVNMLPTALRRGIATLMDIILVVLNTYMFYLSVVFISKSYTKLTPVMGVSSAYITAAVVISFFMMTIYSVVFVYEDFCGKKEGDA